MQGFITFVFLAFLAFIGFAIYFIFKTLQFVIQAINLYKDMITRQDTMIKLLKEIRDLGTGNTSKIQNTSTKANNPSSATTSSSSTRRRSKSNADEAKAPCEHCNKMTSFEKLDMYNGKYICPDCYEKEGKKPLKEMQIEREHLEGTYHAIREKHFNELKDRLKTDNEISILNNMLRLSYDDFIELEAKPEELTETAKDILDLITERIKQIAEDGE